MNTENTVYHRRFFKARPGITLLELLIAVTIFSIAVLGFIGAFIGISKVIRNAKSRMLAATPITMEKLEIMKRTPYYRLMVTTATTNAVESGMGNFKYDIGAYPEENIKIGGITYKRRILVEKVKKVGNDFESISYTMADTGAKRLTVYTIWFEDAEWRKYEVSSLFANPSHTSLASSITGNVKSGGADLENVTVEALQNTAWSGTTDSNGNYAFNVTAGSYTLRASKPGYFPAYISNLSVPDGATVGSPNTDFDLTAKSSGIVLSGVWFAPHPVISQVVASSGTYNGIEVEFVELYNPTTNSFAINDATIELQYREKNVGGGETIIMLDFHTPAIPAESYYLIASTRTFYFQGQMKTADATYDPSQDDYPDIIKNGCDGGVRLRKFGEWTFYDKVAWEKQGGPNYPLDFVEGTQLSIVGGLGDGEQLVRMTLFGAVNPGQARSLDTNQNSLNFLHVDPATHTVYDSSINHTLILNLPAYGAIITADDGLSSPVQAVTAPYLGLNIAGFMLPDIATGTWTVSITSSIYTIQITKVDISSTGSIVFIPNATTVPTGIPGVCFLSSIATSGFLSGTVEKISGAPIQGIPVTASGSDAVTNGDGEFTLEVDAGTHDVEANPAWHALHDNEYSPSTSEGWTVGIGEILGSIDFTLSNAGTVFGWITTNGTDPLPNIPVSAFISGIEMGSALSDVNGYFYIENLSTGTYKITPQLDTSESVDPSTKAVNVATAGVMKWSSTFTLTGAMGTIKGTLRYDFSTISTGVLIVASTATLGAYPPVNNAALRSGGVMYYTGSSMSDGTYKLKVRAGDYNVYGWYNTSRTSTPNVLSSTGSITVAAGGSVILDLDW